MAARWGRWRALGLRTWPKELMTEEEEAARLEQRRREKAVRLSRIRRLMEPSGPPERTLTRSAMEQMRYLRQDSPDEWPVSRLALSFEVSPDVVLRVLKSRFSPSSERALKQDSRVQGQRSCAAGSLPVPKPADQLMLPSRVGTQPLALEAAQRKRPGRSAPQPASSPPQRRQRGAELPTEDDLPTEEEEQPPLRVVQKGREFVDEKGNLLYRIPS